MSNEKGYRFDETFKAFSEFVWKNPKDGILGNAFNMALFYLILGRIPPFLSEAKVGDECQLFLLKLLTIGKIYTIIDT